MMENAPAGAFLRFVRSGEIPATRRPPTRRWKKATRSLGRPPKRNRRNWTTRRNFFAGSGVPSSVRTPANRFQLPHAGVESLTQFSF